MTPPAPTPPPEVIRADPAMRRKAVLLLLTAALVGIVGIRWGLPALQSWVWSDTGLGRVSRARTVCLAFGAVIVATAAGVVWTGVRMVRFGRAAQSVGQFPPPGIPLFRDTRPAIGRPAMILGKLYRGTGILIAVLGGVLLGLGGYAVVLLWP